MINIDKFIVFIIGVKMSVNNHTLSCQHNERCVQYTTKSIAKVASDSGQKADLICNQINRDEIPTECTKKQFRNVKRRLKM